MWSLCSSEKPSNQSNVGAAAAARLVSFPIPICLKSVGKDLFETFHSIPRRRVFAKRNGSRLTIWGLLFTRYLQLDSCCIPIAIELNAIVFFIQNCQRLWTTQNIMHKKSSWPVLRNTVLFLLFVFVFINCIEYPSCLFCIFVPQNIASLPPSAFNYSARWISNTSDLKYPISNIILRRNIWFKIIVINVTHAPCWYLKTKALFS